MPRRQFHIGKLAACVLVVALAGCGGRGGDARRADGASAPDPVETGPGEEARSLFGEPLLRPALDPETRLEREKNLAEAEGRLEAAPGDPGALIWVGRRLAYLGRYREAIEVFTRGIETHPADARFLRHRGHRYLTLREFDLAIRDLAEAARRIEGTADEVEPDGLPNDRGIPTSTLHTNVYYHLGLAAYLGGYFTAARDAYRRGLAASGNPDMACAMSYWLVLAHSRLGEADAAREVLEGITPGMDLIENHDYHRLLLVLRGEVTEAALLEEARGGGAEGIRSATIGYGLGAFRLLRGDREGAVVLWREVLAGPQWAAFGFIAAEADLRRMGEAPTPKPSGGS